MSAVDEATERAERALRVARAAWRRAHRGLPNPPMTRTADVVAIATLAASVIDRTDLGEDELEEEVARAVEVARRVSERHVERAPGNPMMRTAEKASVGILAAGILNRRG